MLMMRITNTASIRLTVYIEAVDKGEDKATIHTEAVEGAYTEEINNMEKTREQDFSRRDAISVIN